jgi:prostatic aicd phosphatase
VESIHNAKFFHEFPTTLLLQARDLANFHEWITFTDPTRGGIGNSAYNPLPFNYMLISSTSVDAYTIIPSLLNGLARVANTTDPLKIHYSAISYKPFISLFNLTAADPINHPVTPGGFGGIVDYASVVVLEVYNDNSLKARYKNGTHDFVDLPLNSSLSSVAGFTAALAVRLSLTVHDFLLANEILIAPWN